MIVLRNVRILSAISFIFCDCHGAAELAERIRDVVAALGPVAGIGKITLTCGVSGQRKNESCDAAIARAVIA